MNPDVPVPAEAPRAAIHRERVEAIEALREQIKTLEGREPELKQEIAAFEKSQRTTIAELEKNQRTTIAELEKKLRTESEDTETLVEELARTRTELAEELARTRSGLAEELGRMRAEHASIVPAVIETRRTLGMKMSDFALEEHEGHEQAIEDLQPLLVELRNDYRRARQLAERETSEAEETTMPTHRKSAEEALAAVELRFQPLIDAEVVATSIESANVRVARHRAALVDPQDKDSRLVSELELEAALEELDAARAKISALQEAKQTAAYHYSHPTAEKSKRLGEKLTKRFGHH